jgi:Uma2 family endonuclease
MASAALPPWDIQRPPPLPVRRFTVEEYRRLAESGILTENDAVELLEGWIVPKMVHNPPHDNAVELTDEALRERLAPGWSIRVQSAIDTADSESEPDLAIVRGSARGRSARHPRADEVVLVVEVADTSLERDRNAKAPIYARAGTPVYWIVNLVDRQLEVYEEPVGRTEAEYRRRSVHLPGNQAALRVDDSVVSIDPADLLP